jgi:hypothetical protein
MGDRTGDTGFWWGSLRERDHLENLFADGLLTLKWIFKKYDAVSGCVDWTHLAHVRDRWRAVVYMATNLQVPQNVGSFLIIGATNNFSRRTLLHACMHDDDDDDDDDDDGKAVQLSNYNLLYPQIVLSMCIRTALLCCKSSTTLCETSFTSA